MMLPKKGICGVSIGLASTFFGLFFIESIEGIFMPKILELRGFSSMDIGELKALGYGTVIAAPFLYALIAQYINNRRFVIIFGAWIAGITVIGMFGNWGFYTFALLLILQNFFQHGSGSQLDALSMNTLEDKNIYGRIRLFGSFGNVASVITGGMVADYFGMLNIVWYLIAIQIILMVVVFGLPSDSLSKEDHKAQRELHAHETKAEKKSHKFPITLSFVLIMLVVILKMMSQGVYANFMMIYMTDDLGMSNGLGGTIMSLGTISEMVGLVISVFFLRHFKVRTLLFMVGIATAFRWFLQGFYGMYMPILVFSQVFHLFTFSILHVTVLKCINEIFKNKAHVALAIGIYGSAGLGLGRILGSLTAGYCWDFGVHTAFTVSIVIALACGVIGLFVKTAGDHDFDKPKDKGPDNPEPVAS